MFTIKIHADGKMLTLGPRRPHHDVMQEFAIDLSFEYDNLWVIIKKQSKIAKYQSNVFSFNRLQKRDGYKIFDRILYYECSTFTEYSSIVERFQKFLVYTYSIVTEPRTACSYTNVWLVELTSRRQWVKCRKCIVSSDDIVKAAERMCEWHIDCHAFRFLILPHPLALCRRIRHQHNNDIKYKLHRVLP